MIILKDVIDDLKTRFKETNEIINNKYGNKYPLKYDKEGWVLIGRKEALAYTITELEKVGVF